MTRKRFVKLLMGAGASRNAAEDLAAAYNLYGWDYEMAYLDMVLPVFDYTNDYLAPARFGERAGCLETSPFTDEEFDQRLRAGRRRRP